MAIVKQCIKCGKLIQLPISEVQYQMWTISDLSVQKMFPTLTPDERELLISGICGECYDELFPEEN